MVHEGQAPTALRSKADDLDAALAAAGEGHGAVRCHGGMITGSDRTERQMGIYDMHISLQWKQSGGGPFTAAARKPLVHQYRT